MPKRAKASSASASESGLSCTSEKSRTRRYLESLHKSFRGGPAGIRALAAALHEDPDTVEHVYEPYLLRLGFIERSPQGRVLTAKGRAYLSGDSLF